VIFYKQFDLSLANLPKGIPFSPAFALNTLTFCNGADRRRRSAAISTFPPICAILIVYLHFTRSLRKERYFL
jgi:hypothetical protein